MIEGGQCAVEINEIDRQTANWSRDEAQNLMTNWLSTGEPFDAVIANNDEMAMGAIQAMKASGISMDDVVVGGIDATQDALLAMAAGELDVTVFQDAAGQGIGSVDAAVALARGEDEGLHPVPTGQTGEPERVHGVIISGFTFLRLDAYYQEVVKGPIIVGALVLDQCGSAAASKM